MTEVAARDGGAWRLACAVLPGLAAAVFAAWSLGPWTALVGLPVVLWRWRSERLPETRLGHGREGWRLDGEPVPPPDVVLDLGGWMLVVCAGRWLPLSPAGAGADWPALRAALYAAVPAPAAVVSA